MEAVLMTPHTAEQSDAPNSNKLQIRIKTPNSKRNNGRGNFISNNPSPSETLESSYAGLLNHPLQRAMSLSQPLFTTHQHRQNQQPPLLPLPNVSTIHHHHHHHQPVLSRSLSSTHALSSFRKDRTINKDMSLTPKKSKPTKREDAAKKRSATLIVQASDNRWGPDPKDLPKHLPVVLTLRGKGLGTVCVENMDMDDMFSSVLSPPPSSLPLPKFSLMRSKLSCNAEAAGVDAGATNNLRRLLRL